MPIPKSDWCPLRDEFPERESITIQVLDGDLAQVVASRGWCRVILGAPLLEIGVQHRGRQRISRHPSRSLTVSAQQVRRAGFENESRRHRASRSRTRPAVRLRTVQKLLPRGQGRNPADVAGNILPLARRLTPRLARLHVSLLISVSLFRRVPNVSLAV